MSALDHQINAICDVLARDPGFVATQDAMRQSKRDGEAARGQQPPKKTALQECAEWHEAEAENLDRGVERGVIPRSVAEFRIKRHARFATACREANEQ